MEDNLLYKYISGEASETEKKEVTEWIQESPEHLHEYLTQRKLYNIALWQDTPIDKNNANKGKVFILRKVGKHSNKCTFYTLSFGCSFAVANTIKPQLL